MANWESQFEGVDYKIKQLEEHIADVKEYASNLQSAFAKAEYFTRNFLDCCLDCGIKTVAIGVSTDKIKESLDFPWIHDSVFASERLDGWPAIWAAADKAGVYGGSGNSGQAQLNGKGSAMLVNGVYEYRDGVWHRLERVRHDE